MTTIEMIRKFPQLPNKPILYVVYNEDHVSSVEEDIAFERSSDYLTRHVTVVPLNTRVDDHSKYEVYIDPAVYVYMHSWNN